MITSYRTINSRSAGLYKEKGSKFISLVYNVETKNEIDNILHALKKEYHDARHHCYAYMLGAGAETFRANDDGEPNHSAGDPILSQIKSLGITNVLIVVVRYFGGTKLGIGGLINAYKAAARDALSHTQVVDIEITKRVVLKYPFSSTNQVMKLIKDFKIKITNQAFDNHCTIEGNVPLQQLPLFEKEIELLNNLGVEVSINLNII